MEPATEFLLWHSPDWREPEGPRTPCMAHEHEALLEQAETALARRREAYPQMIARGQITAEVAEADIAGWELLAAEWRWICGRDGELPHPLTLRARIAAVDLAHERVTAALARGRRTADLIRQLHLVEALRWHLATLKFDAPAVHFWAGLTRKLRAEQAATAAGKEAA